MKYRKIPQTGMEVSEITLGTWAFSSDRWWGHQDESDSFQVIEKALELGVTTIDTAPAYGRGNSERVIGRFLNENQCREKVILATKLGLSWEGKRVYHDLNAKRMREEIDESRKNLQTDFIDMYQVHWPDPDTPIQETAETMHALFEEKIIGSIGVSNYSVDQMKEFMKYSPLHTLQPPYSMLKRDIEPEILPFCRENNIGVLVYSPLQSGILTGKFLLDGVKIPDDLNRKDNQELKEPLASINKEFLISLKEIADQNKKTLGQLVLNWTLQQSGITVVLAGSRRPKQIKENAGGSDWELSTADVEKINQLLRERDEKARGAQG